MSEIGWSNSSDGSIGCRFSSISFEKTIGLNNTSGLGTIVISNKSLIFSGIEGVGLIAGVEVIVGDKVIVGERVIVGVNVIVGVRVIVGEGGNIK